MLIYWRVGNSCNLDCTYCQIPGVRRRGGVGESRPSPDGIQAIARFVRKQIASANGCPPTVVFYGGEPLLYPEAIRGFLQATKDIRLRYVLHTNGTLLSSMAPEFLGDFAFILLSVDGDRQTTDRYRGHGTYDRIREGVDKVRATFQGDIIARATLTPDASVRECVTHLSQWLDGVVWQIENSASYDPVLAEKFLSSYREDLEYLAGLWLAALRNGRVLNILPFQAVMSTLISGRREEHLRCGCGSRLIVIDGDKCFACDELQGIADEVYLGTIEDGVDPFSAEVQSRVNTACRGCRIRYICGGRCYNSLAFFPPDKFRFYCQATAALVDLVCAKAPSAFEFMNAWKMKVEDLVHPALQVVDQIP